MLKKVLSLALAIMMVLSLFVISTSAVASGSIGHKIESDAMVGAQVGSFVTVKVYYVVADDEDLSALEMIGASTTIAYNENYFEYVTDSRVWGDSYAPYIQEASLVNNVNAWKAVAAGIAANSNDSSKGYTNAIIVGQKFETGYTGFPCDPNCEVFTIKFKVVKTLDDTANFGIPESSLAKQTQLKRYNEEHKATTLKAAQMDITEAIKKSNHVSVNYAVSTKVRPNADNAANVDLGFTGSFLNAGLPIEFADGTSTNVSAVGVELTVNGNTNSYQDNFVYENADGNGYNFRVALTGIPAENFNTPIKARMFVIFDGETYYSDYVYTAAAAHVGRLA